MKTYKKIISGVLAVTMIFGMTLTPIRTSITDINASAMYYVDGVSSPECITGAKELKGTISGTIKDIDYKDSSNWYKITVPNGKAMVINLTPTNAFDPSVDKTSNGDSYNHNVRLVQYDYTKKGNSSQLNQNIIARKGYEDKSTGAMSQSCVMPSGTWFFHIEHTNDTEVKYGFNVETTLLSSDGTNEDKSTAQTIEPNVPVTDACYSSGEFIDQKGRTPYYKFNLSSDSEVTFTVTPKKTLKGDNDTSPKLVGYVDYFKDIEPCRLMESSTTTMSLSAGEHFIYFEEYDDEGAEIFSFTMNTGKTENTDKNSEAAETNKTTETNKNAIKTLNTTVEKTVLIKNYIVSSLFE